MSAKGEALGIADMNVFMGQMLFSLLCVDTVGWATGRATGL